MGNANIVGLEESELALRSGDISQQLPQSIKAKSYENLMQTPAFKDFLLRNLDDDFWLANLLEDPNAGVLNSFDAFQAATEEEKQKIHTEIAKMNNCAQAGINLRLTEVLSTLERNLRTVSVAESMPYLSSFQRRLVVYGALREALEYERKLTFNVETNMSASVSQLNSKSFPELLAINSMSSFGLSLLKMFPALFDAMNPEDKRFHVPLLQLAENLTSMGDKVLFPSWSPRKKRPLISIPIAESNILVNKKRQGPLGPWNCKGGTFDVSFDGPVAVSTIMASWAPPNSINSENKLGIPEWFTVSVRNSSSAVFQEIGCFYPDKEKDLQGSWTQFYEVETKDVAVLRLTFSRRLSTSSTLSECKLFKFNVFAGDNAVEHVDVQGLLISAQISLVNILPHATVDSSTAPKVWKAALALIRSSASLHVLLNFLERGVSPSISLADDSALGLLKCMHAELTSLVDQYNRTFCTAVDAVDKVHFSDSGLSDGFTVHDNGKKITCSGVNNLVGDESSTAKKTASGYATLPFPMDSGVYEWELEFVNPVDISVGVVTNGCEGDIQTVSRNAWLIPSNGTVLRAKGEIGDLKVPVFGPSACRCVFTYDTRTKFLTFNLDGISHGVVFEDINVTVVPIVIFKALSDSTEREVSITRFSKASSSRKETEQLAALPLSESASSFTDGVWLLLAELSKVHLTWLEHIPEKGYALEHPFCAEVSIPVIETLSKMALHHLNDGQTAVVPKILSVLELQFAIMSGSNLSLDHVHRYLAESLSKDHPLERATPNLVALKDVLLRLIKSNDHVLKLSAVKTFCRGIDIFLPQGAERVATLVEMLRYRHLAGNDASDLLIMEMVLERLGTTKQITDIVDLFVRTGDANITAFIPLVLEITRAELLSNLQAQPLEPSSFIKLATTTISKLSEEVTLRITTSENVKSIRMHDLFICLLKALVKESSQLLAGINEATVTLDEFGRDEWLQSSFFGSVLFPLLHVTCMPTFPSDMLSKCYPLLVTLSEALSPIITKFSSCQKARQLLASSLRGGSNDASSGTKGWKTIKAIFDDTDNTFTINDNGMTFTSIQSTNTCALVNVGFGAGDKAAWEFLLEVDSNSDECSVFGAARKPLNSRCYSSSQDLWMRRAYNGYMYAQGATTGQHMDKIHPSDVVRIEFDGDAGTLSYSVNGGPLELGFSNITDEVYPACGSYRNGVSIKLLKVEVFQFQSEDTWQSGQESRPLAEMGWVSSNTDVVLHNGTEPNLLVHPLTKEKIKPTKSTKAWATGRGSRGGYFGVHEWAYVFADEPDGRFEFGAVVGTFAHDKSLSDLNLTTKSETLPGTGATEDSYTLAWTSTGALFFNGKRIRDNYGLEGFPFSKGTIVRMQVNFEKRTISFNVNGTSMGVAFDDRVPGVKRMFRRLSVKHLLFPAVSINKIGTKLILSGSGLGGSTVIPFAMSAAYSLSCIVGQTTLQLLTMNPVEKKERDLLPWLQSPLFIAGISPNLQLMRDIGLLSDTSYKFLLASMAPFQAMLDKDAVPLDTQLLDFVRFDGLNPMSESANRFLEWMESQEPELPALRKMLERNGTYRFLVCELPYIACLIRQAGLEKEFAVIMTKLQAGEQPSCSADMALVWQKTKQLRVYLRVQRQKLLAAAASAAEVAAEEVSPSPTPAPSSPLPATATSDSVPTAESSASETSSGEAASSEAASSDSANTVLSATDRSDSPVPYASPSSASSESFVNYFETVKWLVPGQWQCNVKKGDSTLTISRIGVDAVRKIIIIEAAVKSINRNVDLDTSLFDSAVLTINETDYNELNVTELKKQQARLMVSLTFYVSAEVAELESLHNIDAKFAIGSGADVATIELSQKVTSETASERTAFELLCQKITKKAQFLFFMNVAESSTQFSSRGKLLGLSSMYSTVSGVSLQPKLSDLSRWKTPQERWKRVIHFLHVQQSKIKKQLSFTAVGEDGALPPPATAFQRQPSLTFQDPPSNVDRDEALVDEAFSTSAISNANATIQACGVFITSEDLDWSANSLADVISQRLRRAHLRLDALRCLGQYLSLDIHHIDPFLPFAVTSYLQNFLRQTPEPQGDKLVPSEKITVHYLCNLEGCPTRVLREVQDVFAHLYKELAKVFTLLVLHWDDGSHRRGTIDGTEMSIGAAATSSSIGPDVAVKDTAGSAHGMDSALMLYPVTNILRLWGLQFSGRDVSWIHDSGLLPMLHKVCSFPFYERQASEWRQAAAKLLSVMLEDREASQALKGKFRLWAQKTVDTNVLNGSLTGRELFVHAVLSSCSMLSQDDMDAIVTPKTLTTLLDPIRVEARAGHLYCHTSLAVAKKDDDEDANKPKKNASETTPTIEEVPVEMEACGMFDPNHKASRMTLSEGNRLLTFVGNNDRSAVIAFGNLPFHRDHVETRGNYFEITIVQLGAGDIGIGLAAANVPTSSQMPGWVSHSYGYHGDDGRKFGAGKTAGDWPLFAAGDIIGCGVDFTRQIIFFTRNGSLLGTAFEGVSEEELFPVVGLSNRNLLTCSLKINFGMEPFAYGDAQAIGNKLAIDERIKREAAYEMAWQAAALSASLAGASATADDVNDVPPPVVDAWTTVLAEFREKDLKMKELSQLRNMSSGLLRYLLFTFSKLSQDRDVSFEATLSTDDAQIEKPALVKEVSTFGTPKLETSFDALHVQSTIIRALCHEIAVGAEYLRQWERAGHAPRSTYEIENDLLLGGIHREVSSMAPPVVLERHEVSHMMQADLQTFSLLCATSLAAKADLSQTPVLRTLLRILDCEGSTTQLVVMSLLRSLLPQLDPACVEEAFTAADLLSTPDSTVNSDATLPPPPPPAPVHEGRRAARRLPDHFVRTILSHIAKVLDTDPASATDTTSTTTSFTEGKATVAHGQGSLLTSIGYAKIKLLQALFEAPSWSEVIAYNILHALKSADQLLREETLAAKATTTPATQRHIYMMACAAASCLGSTAIALSGSMVQSELGAQFVLISASPYAAEKDVVQVENIRDFSFTKHIETVHRSKLTLVPTSVAVDFSKLSLPLVTHLMSLVESLLGWLVVRMGNPESAIFAELTEVERQRLRLANFLLFSTSTLLQSQPDVMIDGIQEADILSVLGHLATLCQPMDTLYSMAKLQELWRLSQEKCLEGYYSSFGGRKMLQRQLSGGSTVSNGLGDDGGLSMMEIDEGSSDRGLFEISVVSRMTRDQLVKSFAEKHNISEEKSIRILEHAEMDMELAESMVSRFPDEAEASRAWFRTALVNSVDETPTLSDENVLKGIEHAATKFTDEKRESSHSSWLLEALTPADKVDVPFFVLASTDEGKSPCEPEQVGTCREIYDTDALVEMVSMERGVSLMKLLPLTTLRKIKEWYGLSPKYIPLQASKIDFGLSLLSSRQLVSQLISCGGAMSSSLFTDVQKGVSVIKLASIASAKSNTDDSFRLMVEGFSAPAATASSSSTTSSAATAAAAAASTILEDGEDGEQRLVESIVEDATSMLDAICSTSLAKRTTVSAGSSGASTSSSSSTTDLGESQGFRITSPHPFVTLREHVGKIVVPSTWTGATVKFHPNCRTPTDRAVLQFFQSTEDFLASSPSHSFSGTNFQEFPVACGAPLYYKFIARMGSDRAPLAITVVTGDAAMEPGHTNVISLSANPPVGLGTEDNLFNLFSDGDGSATSLAMAACQPLSSGLWCFEVTVKTLGIDPATAAIGFVGEHVTTSEVNELDPSQALVFSTDISRASSVLGAWEDGDVLTVMIAFQEASTVLFMGRNGRWEVQHRPYAMSNLKPAILLSQKMRLAVNFGDLPFAYICTDATLLSAYQCRIEDLKACHLNQDDSLLLEQAWGYDFVVKPIVGLDVILTNEFELVWSSKSDDSSGTIKPGEPGTKFWVWRAKARKNYLPVADIITLSPHPPTRSILLNRAQTKAPQSFACVFNSSKVSFAVWRPKPPENYVSLGDVVNNSSSGTSMPSVSTIVCVPKWATKACVVSQRMTIFKKVGNDAKKETTPSLWRLDNDFGFFHGSPYDKRTSDAPRSDHFAFDGVGEAHTLLMNIGSHILADWTTEASIYTQPSLPWVNTVLSTLLQSNKWRHVVLKDTLFKSLVKYLKTSTAVTPIKLVPLLIQMVRQAYKANVPLPLDEVKNLCGVVLNEAIGLIQSNKKSEVPKSLTTLVDLVVEIQAVLVQESTKKDRVSRSRQAAIVRMQKEMLESKEDDDVDGYAAGGGSSGLIEEKEGDASDDLNAAVTAASAASSTWWDRPPLDIIDVKVHRVIRKDNLEGLFSKESVLLKLKQALKFLHALRRQDAAAAVATTAGASALPAISSASAAAAAAAAAETNDETANDRSYPKLMTSKIWFEHISRCAYVESFHPYRERRFFKHVRFPGAQQLTVTFDKRTALAAGDELVITVPQGTSVWIKGPIANESDLKDLRLTTDEVVISFTSDASRSETNPTREWGWGVLVAASGPIFESAVHRVDLAQEITAMEARRVLAIEEEQQDASGEDAGMGRLDRERSRGFSLGGYGSDSDTGSEESGPTCALDVPFVCRPPLFRLRPEEKAFYVAPATATAAATAAISSTAAASDATSTEALALLMAENSSAIDVSGGTGDDGDDADGEGGDTPGAPGSDGGDESVLDSIGSPRPKSSRGKRSTAATAAAAADNATVGTTSTTGGGEASSDPLNPLLVYGPEPEKAIVVQHGQLLKKGSISVPHALELDVKIERVTPPTPSTDGDQATTKFTYVLLARSSKIEPATAHVVDANWSGKLTVSGHTMHYQLWALEADKVAAILNPSTATEATETAEAAETVEDAEAAATTDPAAAEAVTSAATNDDALVGVTEQMADDAEAADRWADLAASGTILSATEITAAVAAAHRELAGMSGGWSCMLCTLINDDSDTVCAVCGTRREAGEAAEAEMAGWYCPLCTLINPLTVQSCGACGQARPADADGEVAADADESTADSPTRPTSSSAETDADSSDRRPITPVPSSVTTNDATTTNAANTAVNAGAAKARDEIRITAVGKMTNHGRFETRLEAALLSRRCMMTPLQVHFRMAQWTKECDDALLEFLNNPSNQLQQQKSDHNPLAFTLPKNYLAYRGAVLNRMNLLDIIVRVQMIEACNKTLEHLLPLIDLSNEDPLSLGALIRRSNRYLLLKLKQPLLKKAITATEVSTGGDVPVVMVLSNFKSLLSRENGERDPTVSQNCFVQAFNQLRKKDSLVYRHSNERVFTITFADESGIDAGGVFREGMSRIVEDLFSPDFNLLLQCPNGQDDDIVVGDDGVGPTGGGGGGGGGGGARSNVDKFVPNPKQNGPLALEMFEFIGKLMATSIRAKLCLPFAFPPLVWKKLVDDEVTPFDLMEVDMVAFKQLEEIEHCDSDIHDTIVDQVGFSRRFENKLRFAYVGSDKELHEVCPGGLTKEVTFDNRSEYVTLVRQARLREFDVHIEAMARGMAQVIPARVLLLFSAAQMEELVCGSPVIDLNLWQEMTESSGVSAKTVELFWQVMRTLTPEEHSGFIRFAWGRSRLPSRREDFTTKMRLTNGGRAAMPVSHTCFFSIELPEYRTADEMRHGLLTAIYYGVGGILNG